MSKISEITLPESFKGIDGILAGIKQDRYRDAIRNACASFSPTLVAESPSIDMVYLYARPEYVVATAISEGKSPYVALDEWLVAVGHMLAVYRKSRRKSVLFEVASAMGYCGRELPLESTDINLALAALAVSQSGEIKSTLDELTASSIPLEGWNQPPNLDLADISEQYCLHNKSADLVEENSCLKSELDLQKKQLNQLEGDREKQREINEELIKENDLLLLQLHHVQEELEQYYLKLQAVSLQEDNIEMRQADLEPKPPILPQSVKPKRRSAFVRKIVALKRLRGEAALLKSSQLFDGAWYLQRYADVAAAKMDPVRHYLRFGAVERRNPGPDFNTEWYLRQYPDVAESGLNPLVHYLKYGRNENRTKTEWSWN